MMTSTPTGPFAAIVQQTHAERRGSGFIAKCPAHEDRNPSLSIKEGGDGRVLLFCHAGCPTENIVAALGVGDERFVPA